MNGARMVNIQRGSTKAPPFARVCISAALVAFGQTQIGWLTSCLERPFCCKPKVWTFLWPGSEMATLSRNRTKPVSPWSRQKTELGSDSPVPRVPFPEVLGKLPAGLVPGQTQTNCFVFEKGNGKPPHRAKSKAFVRREAVQNEETFGHPGGRAGAGEASEGAAGRKGLGGAIDQLRVKKSRLVG